MKKALLLLLVCALGFTVYGQTISLRSADKAECVKSDMNGLHASFSFASIEAENMETERGAFSWINLANTVIGGNEGDPQIPVVNELIAIPFGANPRIEITSYNMTDYRLSDFGINTLVPRQPSLRKDQKPEEVPFVYNATAYQTRGLATAPRATVAVDGVMRGIQVGKMSIEPVSYDPVNNTLRVFNDIEVEVYFDGADIKETENTLLKTYTPYFDIVYSQLFNGRAVTDVYSSHPDLYTTPVKMIVITTSTYANNATFQNWVNWKKQKGIYTTVYTTATTGTSASNIKSFIRNCYSNSAPTFVVIVGDTGDVTYSLNSSTTSKVTDLYYSSTSDSDLYPEMFLSRMPVSSTTELTNLLNKIMTYEKYTMADPSYLNNVLLIAGYDATWRAKVGIPTINYGTTNYFNSAHGYTNVYKYTTSYTNCYNNLSTGVGFANYTAHGDNTMWYQPQITASDVSSLTNNDKYFWAMGNCCLAANWGYSGTSFAEALLRAANKGAFGYIGSCPETYWYEDYYFGVGATSVFNQEPSYSQTATGTYDGMFMDDKFNTLNAVPYLGNLAVAYAYAGGYTTSISEKYYWEAYHCLGDGSVMPYHVNPSANNVSHDSSLPMGATSFTVSAHAGSYVSITVNNEIIGVAQVPSSGTVNVPITAQNNTGTARIVVTRQQRQPYIQDITIGGGTATTYYAISATANPTAGGTISGTGNYAEGATCTLTATAATGYQFSNWTKNGTQVSTNATYSFTVQANATYVANFVESQVADLTIGSGTSYNNYIPTYSYYNYSLTEQIYTAAEIGRAGTITAISFKVSNSKSTTRNVDLYLKHTTKTAFTSRTGWETLSSSYKVFSGNVSFNASGWTTIILDTPFSYDGTSNLLVGMDDNTGSYVSSSSNSPRFYVYSTGANRAMRIYSDNTNYNPASPTSYSGSYVTSNNQIMISMNAAGGATVNTYTITASANPTAGGSVSGAGTYDEGETVTLTATPATGYQFSRWTRNGTQVSTNASYSFTASADAAYVAQFTLKSFSVTATASPAAGGTVTGAGTYNYGATATLTANANDGYTFTNWTRNGTQVSSNATYSFTVTAAAALTANFAVEQVMPDYYDITVADVPNGTVSANKTSAAEGETVTLSVTPDNGCTFYTWVVFMTGDVNTTVNVSNNKFTMPGYDVTVVAVIKPNGTSGGSGGEVAIGSGSSTNAYLPTYSYYNYSFTEQIYTAAEIGQAGTITAVSFRVSNAKSTTRNVDLYMKTTSKSAFTSRTGWESLSTSYRVFSGNVSFNASGWTTITLNTPFEYNGSSNLLVGMDDNTGSYVSGSSNSPQFYVYSTGGNRAMRIYSDGTNYNPASPSSYRGTYVTSNNQIVFSMAGGASTGGSTEALVVTPKTMTGFSYAVGNGPSAVQTFAVIGADLSSDITITAPADYEISDSPNGTFRSSLTLSGNRSRGTLTWGFEGSMDNWSSIDADGDGYNWQLASVLMSGYNITAHGGSDMLSSESYNRSAGALTPDNWLVSPQVTLGGTFSMYASAQDANYAAEHFGIYVSTGSNTNTSNFVKLGEWTLSAKGTRAQGAWYQVSVDLSAYAGMTGYIAVRHFNCTDQFYLNVDDFSLTYDEGGSVTPSTPSTGAEFLKANVYVRLKSGRSTGNYNESASVATTGLGRTVSLYGTVTGSKSFSDNETLVIYPNPAIRGQEINVQLPFEADEAQVEVFNVVGACVIRETVSGNSQINCLYDLAPGLYTVRVIANGEVNSGKLIVQ
ncbi:MAG: choice-of-anchor J domain-containing protein [Bacteroidales bacterium]|nr:choice-of-anchor J domain-containing protein [Bacteroidales bacterium]